MEGKVLLVLSVSVLVVVFSKLKSLVVAKPRHNLPPGPWTLPVIGSLHHLVTSPNIYRAVRMLAQKHGDLMTLRLGMAPAMVVSSPAGAQEVMKTHDVTFADPYVTTTTSTLTFDGNDIAFSPYGERWRQLRRICVLELFSPAREAARLAESLAACAAGGAAVDLTGMISRFVNDTVVRELVGSRSKHRDEFLDTLDKAMRQTGLGVADLFPVSNNLDGVLACRDSFQRIVVQIIQETMEAMDGGGNEAAAGTGSEGLLGVLLRLQKESSTPIPLDDDTIVAVMLEMFAAGSDTSSTLLNWCMTDLVRTPEAMAKAQTEEALRLHTPAPVLVPRVCRETCQIMGYDVPKGTVVFVNMWAICRDPRYWDDPEEFKPERFENSDLDFKGTNYEFLPFGAGRRICPGINLGVLNIELALASLLYHFDWKLPHGMGPKDVDVCEAAGLLASKKTSLILHPVTRIPPASVEK
ncbi:hypothetical protein PVAP13_8NG081600 [Panicum virgatum]|uniref:Uncharacterized protein n=1 Tax=Panicum virgatum TaxID=38727 RepID=A0A8T0P405_PANVG|nr:hypothetical protein PVAP13_8NG081600 [Panicum virgatum]